MDHLHKPEAGSVVPIPQSGGSAKRKADEISSESAKQTTNSTMEALSSTRANKPNSSDLGEIATIQVGSGEQQRTFYAHKALLSFYSGYFKAAFKGGWKESETSIINLDTEDADVFERFALWLYFGRIHDNKLESDFHIIVQLWLFGDRRQIPLLMNEMINCLKKRVLTKWELPTQELRVVYDETLADSPLRKMLIAIVAHLSGDKIFNGDVGSGNYALWPKEAIWDLSKMVLSPNPRLPAMTKEQFKTFKVCTFHVHEDGVTCDGK